MYAPSIFFRFVELRVGCHEGAWRGCAGACNAVCTCDGCAAHLSHVRRLRCGWDLRDPPILSTPELPPAIIQLLLFLCGSFTRTLLPQQHRRRDQPVR